MPTADHIVYLERKDIDVDRWNACIEKAENGLIYAYSYYLDAMCTNWSALVLRDYEAVMPLPWRKKWGITYVYQPPFIQRLGVFGNKIPSETLQLFYSKALSKFKFLHYNINQSLNKPFLQTQRKNFILDLNKSYGQISSVFTKECSQNIRRAINRGCLLTPGNSITDIVRIYRNAYGKKNSSIKTSDYDNLISLFGKLQQQDKALLFEVKNELGKPIFGSVILKDNRRFYYVLGAPTEEGRRKRATYFFINEFVRSNAEHKMLFDFEGSDIPNVENFYKKFGPQAEDYYELKASNIPLLIKLL